MPNATPEADIAVIGLGAAGLFASIWAGRHRPGLRILGLDGARTLGAKILVAGGGRCNVTHWQVDESAYAGSTPPAIRNVLRRFTVADTVAFFNGLGVELKREDTGKLFPTTDDARTVLDALLRAARSAGVQMIHPWRVASITREAGGFLIERSRADAAPGHDRLSARRVILCTGGQSLPKSGSDGQGFALARSLGHTVTPRLLPALVPLLLPQGHVLTTLSGLTLNATLELRAPTGKRLAAFTNSTLLTHFGLSGPSVMDISRYYLEAQADGGRLFLNLLPDVTPASLDEQLQFLGKKAVGRWLCDGPGRLPERLVRAVCTHCAVDFNTPGASLTRDQRRKLVTAFADQELPVTGHRGWNYAEATAGGVPLNELRLDTMESRVCPGLHLAGEICDVDGRIGGFNFQWAWSSGSTAGRGAAASLQETSTPNTGA